MHKDELRRHIREIKRQFTPRELEHLSLPVIRRLRPRLEEASTVLAYYSLPDEVDTHRLIDELVRGGKKVLLPKVVDQERMELRQYTGIQDMCEGAYHIMEPHGRLFTDYQEIDIVLVPGLAFDGEGRRLGRGRGYYDRFLRLLGTDSKASVIGVCFDFQKVAEVPYGRYDIPVDEVI